MHIPATIKRHIAAQDAVLDKVGCSDAQVMMFDDMVLKIQPDSNMASNEHRMTRWLQEKLPVPQIIEEAHVDGMRYLLMTKVKGHNLCDAAILDDQVLLADLMAEGLQRLWAVEPDDCPTKMILEHKFRYIEDALRNDCLTREQYMQPENYGSDEFKTPAQLFDWLVKHRPAEEPVISHGDYCLPNIMADETGLVGFIDLGYAGVADKWVDIEKGLWSMWANTAGRFGGAKRPFDRKYLFEALNIQPDDEKLRYYSLLNELF